MKYLKLLIIASSVASLFFQSCTKDDGYRVVTVELEIAEIPSETIIAASMIISSDNPNVSAWVSHQSEGPLAKVSQISEEIALPVGTNVSYNLYVDGYEGVQRILPADVKIKVRAGNKTIFSESYPKGMDVLSANIIPNGNIIVR